MRGIKMFDWMTWNSTKDGKPRPEPVFCNRCGTKLVPNDSISGYDEYTGNPIRPFMYQKVCRDSHCSLMSSWGTLT